MYKIIYLLVLLFSLSTFAQLVTWEPVYFTEDDSVTVYFDATLGNGGLEDYTGDVYAHTGVLINNSSSSSDWYAAPQWLNNADRYKLTKIADNLYQLNIGPSVFEYYSTAPTQKPISESDEITHLAFVFRNADGSREGKGEGNSDIFVELRTGVSIVSPVERPYNAELNQVFEVKAVGSSITDSLKLFINDELVETTSTDTLNYSITADQFKEWIKVVGITNIGITVADSFYYYVNPEITEAELPAGIVDGINYIDDNSVTLSLYAEGKDFIYVIGDFNNWEIDPDYFMNRTPDGERYWITIEDLTSGEEYAFQYLVEGNLRIADPYTTKVLDPWNDSYIPESVYPNLKSYPSNKTQEVVSVLQTAKPEYEWQIENFERPDQEKLVIYEMLIRDFVASHSYKTLIDTLDYLENLGINAIELMPVNEFEGNLSWGYNPSFMFAVDKYYGTEEDLKKFIDECHVRGIAVIFDMVLNHQFGQSPLVRLYWDDVYNRPSAENPWFNQVPNHESALTQEYVDRVNRYWLEEFKFDGYRFDLSKGFMQTGSFYDYNASRIVLLKRMYDQVRTYDENAYMILEHLGANNEEKELSNYGFMLWGNMNYNYNEATMGYHDNNKSDLSWISYQTRGWNNPHVVGYMESHDEERLMYKNLEYGNSNGSYNIQNLVTALQRMKMAASFFFTIPGPKMIWQFGELGYDFSINYPSGTENDRLTPKPIRWDYLDNVYREKLYKTFSALIKLKKNYDVFSTDNFELNVSGSIKTIKLNHESMDVFIIGNFGVTSNTLPLDFQHQGMWYDYFSGDSVNYSGSNPVELLEPGEFHIYTTEKLPTPEGDLLSNINELEENITTNYFLLQNYPNPFNPSTTIKFTISQSGFVSLKVYNILGQEVKILLSKEITPGVYSVDWNGTNNYGDQLSSGVYFYRIEAGDFIQTKKMLFVK
jgi:1,4-alpha-glucan branching enzyme